MVEVSGIILTYNSEKTIEIPLKNMTGKVDELIVVDTGSTDDTTDIAEEYGAKVVVIPQRLHFGDLRNAAIQKSFGKWIFMLDDDEYIEEKFYGMLRTLIRSNKADAYKIPRKNYVDGEFKKEFYPDYQVRLFRRYCRWIYPVHEVLVGADNILPLDEVNIIHSKAKEKAQKSAWLWRYLEELNLGYDLPEHRAGLTK